MVNADLALAIIPKIGSSLSMASSSFIISEAISDHRKSKGTAIAALARGNMASCNFQGFLLQLAGWGEFLSASIDNGHDMIAMFNWTNEQLVKIERYVHGFIIVFSVGISIAGLPTKMYSKINTVCWVIGVPSECGNSSSEPSDIPCERGDWAWPFGILLFYGPLWLCVLLTIIAMIMIYVHVRNTFRKNEKYQFQGKLRRPTSVMTRNRSGHTEPTQVKTESGMTDSGRPPQGGNSGGTQVDSVGQISSRMGRFSVFSAQKKADLRKLDEPQGAMGQKEQGDIDGVDHAEEEKQSEAGMKKSERNGDSRLSPPHGR